MWQKMLQVGSGGVAPKDTGFFELELPITADSSLVGQPWTLYLKDKNGNLSPQETAKTGKIKATDTFTMGYTGEYLLEYGNNKYTVPIEVQDYQTVVPSTLNLSSETALVPLWEGTNSTMDYQGGGYAGNGTYKVQWYGYEYFPHYKLYDGDITTNGGLHGTDPAHGIQFPRIVKVTKAEIYAHGNTAGYPITAIKIYSSNDGGKTQTLVYNEPITGDDGVNFKKYTAELSTPALGNWFGFYLVSGSGKYASEVQWYGSVV